MDSKTLVTSASCDRMSALVRKMDSSEAHERDTLSHSLITSCTSESVACHFSTLGLKNSTNLPIPSMVWSSSMCASSDSMISSLSRMSDISVSLCLTYSSMKPPQLALMSSSFFSIFFSFCAVSTTSCTSSTYSCRLNFIMSCSKNSGCVGSTTEALQTRASCDQCRGANASECRSAINGSTMLMLRIAASMSRKTTQPLTTGSAAPEARKALSSALFSTSSLSVSTALHLDFFQPE
mmetsp:Transcript_25191/g.84668  ORF Transcript_25191/g.84668 Transcript_25191/m.84668 type:complete len:237 (-) Transcript_25191:4071-4781(-)